MQASPSGIAGRSCHDSATSLLLGCSSRVVVLLGGPFEQMSHDRGSHAYHYMARTDALAIEHKRAWLTGRPRSALVHVSSQRSPEKTWLLRLSMAPPPAGVPGSPVEERSSATTDFRLVGACSASSSKTATVAA